MIITHKKVSAKADSSDATLVNASDWNDDHALSSPVSALTISSGVVNIDCALGDYYTLALSANVTSITFSNLPAAAEAAAKTIKITQDASAAMTLAFPASFKWAGGTVGVVSTTLSAVDRLVIVSDDQGTTWHATLGKAFA
jgi:hypothetical protein